MSLKSADQPGVSLTLVFGASGALGRVVARHLERDGASVVRVTRSATRSSAGPRWLSTDMADWAQGFAPLSVGGAVWAGGANVANSLSDRGSRPGRHVRGKRRSMSRTPWRPSSPPAAWHVGAASWCSDPSGTRWLGIASPPDIASKAAVSGFVRAARRRPGPPGHQDQRPPPGRDRHPNDARQPQPAAGRVRRRRDPSRQAGERRRGGVSNAVPP